MYRLSIAEIFARTYFEMPIRNNIRWIVIAICRLITGTFVVDLYQCQHFYQSGFTR